MSETWVLVYAACVVAAAGCVRSFTGFGGPLIMVALPAFTMPPAAFVPLVPSRTCVLGS